MRVVRKLNMLLRLSATGFADNCGVVALRYVPALP